MPEGTFPLCAACGHRQTAAGTFCGYCGSPLEPPARRAPEPAKTDSRAGENAPRWAWISALLIVAVLLFLGYTLHRSAQTAAPGSRADDTNGPMRFVDLTACGNQSLSEGMHNNPGNSLIGVPGVVRSGESEFRVGSRFIHLRGQYAPGLPLQSPGIRVDSPFRRLHLLHACGYGGGEGDGQHIVGKEIGRYTLSYDDGQTRTIPVRYGYEVCDWWGWGDYPQPVGSQRAVVAWTGANPASRQRNVGIRLYVTVWPNPRPDRPVTTIGFNSAGQMCDPFLVAMTLEKD